MKSVRLPFMLLSFLVFALLAGPWGLDAFAGEEVSDEAASGEKIVRQGVLIPYEITGPDGWTYRSKPHQHVLGVFEPEGDSFYPYISLTKVGGLFERYWTPEELVQRNLYERPGAHLISSEWVEHEDYSFLHAEFGWSSDLGEIQVIKAFHPWNRSVLVVTAASFADDFEEYRAQFLESLMSVQVKTHPDEKKRHKDSEGAASDDAWLYGDQ